MKNFIYQLLLPIIIGCDVNDSVQVERTYPEAFNFETVTLQELLETSPTDSLNIEVFVDGVSLESECPNDPLAVCFGDGIFVSDMPDPSPDDQRYAFHVNEPLQFQKGKKYTMSFKIESVGSEGSTRITLVGYSELPIFLALTKN